VILGYTLSGFEMLNLDEILNYLWLRSFVVYVEWLWITELLSEIEPIWDVEFELKLEIPLDAELLWKMIPILNNKPRWNSDPSSISVIPAIIEPFHFHFVWLSGDPYVLLEKHMKNGISPPARAIEER